MDKIKEFFKNYWLFVAIGLVGAYFLFFRKKTGTTSRKRWNF